VSKPVAVLQESDIITPEECAAMLRVQPTFIYEKCRRRSRDPLPCHRIGRYLRFSRREVLEWFDRTAAPVKKVRR
jgi:excisionase family DNA binding protein